MNSKRMRTRGAVLGLWLAVAAVAAVAQKGPQDNFVFEPDLAWGSTGTGNGQFTPGSIGFSSPAYNTYPLFGLAADTTNIFVADSGNNRIQVFGKDGTYLRQWGASGSSTGQFAAMTGVAVDDSNVFVTEANNNRVQVFTKYGAFVRKWGGTGSGNGSNQFNHPMGIAVDTQNVYVADTVNHRIQVFDKSGSLVKTWGSFGTVAGQFNTPVSVAADGRNVFVVDAFNKRLQVFDTGGNFARSWNLPINVPGDGLWQSAFSVAVDIHSVYVGLMQSYSSAPQATYLQAYDKYGTLLWQSVTTNTLPLRWVTGISAGSPLAYIADFSGPYVLPLRRIFRTLGPLVPNPIPLAEVLAVNQRNGSAVLDVDYRVTDENDATVTVYAAAFAIRTNAVPHLSDIVPMRTFVDETSSNIGPGVLTGVAHRLSWDTAADNLAGKLPQYGNLKVALLAKDNRGLLDMHFLQIPAVGTNVSFKISRDALLDTDMLPLWFWLLAAGDTNVSLNNGQVLGLGGAYDGQLLAQSTNTTTAGRAFLFSRLNVREATAGELTTARQAGTTNAVIQWDPRRQPPAAGSKVNAFNFVTYPTNGWWVVPLGL